MIFQENGAVIHISDKASFKSKSIRRNKKVQIGPNTIIAGDFSYPTISNR
jgi:hypothetical protein